MGLHCVCVLEGKEVDVGSKHGHGVGLHGGEQKMNVLILAHRQFYIIQFIDLRLKYMN